MGDVEVRAAGPGDEEAALRLAPRLTEGVAAWRDPEAVRRAVHGWVRDRFTASATSATEDWQAFVAERSGVVVGFAAVEAHDHWTGDRDAYIGELVVDPAAEGLGVGRALVDAVTAWARAHGLGRVTLATGAANGPARGFYSRLGFAEEDVLLTLPLERAPGRMS